MNPKLLKQCKEKNTVIEGVFTRRPGRTLKEHLISQVELIEKNKARVSYRPPEDFLTLVKQYCRSHMGTAEAEQVDRVFRYGAINTADHHGGYYSTQSFQGDLLYWALLKEAGVDVHYLPICSFGLVRLGNAAFSRGILSYESKTGVTKIPIFPKKMENQIVSGTPAFKRRQIEQTISLAKDRLGETRQRDVILEVLNDIYLAEDILRLPGYSDQAAEIGRRLSARAFQSDALPEFLYIEMEPIMNQLFFIDLQRENSLLRLLLQDRALLKELNRECVKAGQPLSSLLFFGIDKKKRRFSITIGEDQVLRGTALGGERLACRAGTAELTRLAEQGVIGLSGYAIAAMLFWERGLSWMGGVFQAEYLPDWQRRTVNCLMRAGQDEWAEKVGRPDCSGYISGPLFMIAAAEEGAAGPVGPLELMRQGGIGLPKLERRLQTTLEASHIMGLFEFYHDLVPGKARLEGWYESIAKGLPEKFAENLI